MAPKSRDKGKQKETEKEPQGSSSSPSVEPEKAPAAAAAPSRKRKAPGAADISEQQQDSGPVRKSQRIKDASGQQRHALTILASQHNHLIAAPPKPAKVIPLTSQTVFPAFLGTISLPGQQIRQQAYDRFKLDKHGSLPVTFGRGSNNNLYFYVKNSGFHSEFNWEPADDTVLVVMPVLLLLAKLQALTRAGALTNEAKVTFNRTTQSLDLTFDVTLQPKAVTYSGDAFMDRQSHQFDYDMRYFINEWLNQPNRDESVKAIKLGPESNQYFLETLRPQAKKQYDSDVKKGLIRRASLFDENIDDASSSSSSSSSSTAAAAAAAASTSTHPQTPSMQRVKSFEAGTAPPPNPTLSPEMRRKGSKFIEQQDQYSLYSLLESLRPDPASPRTPTPTGLLCNLLPFQEQALHWMIHEEKQEPVTSLHPLWDQIQLPTNPPTYVYMNKVHGTLSKYRHSAPACEPGGFLADEMGLGKTLETLALVLAHPRDFRVPDHSRSAALMSKKTDPPLPVKTTLIVVPSSLLEQWESECEKHVGNHLKVYRFPDPRDGCPNAGCGRETPCVPCKRFQTHFEANGSNYIQMIANSDVILTTYDSLQKAIRGDHAALLKVQWWRVMLDEAQMVFNAATGAAIMASELWRVNAWCVSGTPLSNSLTDIHGLMVFLDSDPFADRRALISALTQPYEQRKSGSFYNLAGFLSRFMWRHAKAHVEDQIKLPECTQVTLEFDLDPEEQLNYERYFGIFKHDLITLLRRHHHLGMNRDVSSRLQFLREVCSNPHVQPDFGGPLSQLGKKPFVAMSLGDLLRESLEQAQKNLESALKGLEREEQRLNEGKQGGSKAPVRNAATQVTVAQYEKLVERAGGEVRHIEEKLKEFQAQLTKKATFKSPAPLSATNAAVEAGDAAEKGKDKEPEPEPEDEANTCPVCLDAFEDPVITKCLHQYCMECVYGLLGNNRVVPCPLCRQPMSHDELVRVLTENEPVEPRTFADQFGGKISTLLSHISGGIAAEDPGEPFKCVVFSHWNSVLDQIYQALTASGITSLKFYGAVKERTGMVNTFQSDPKTRVILVSMRAGQHSGAMGLTLTAASVVYLMEPSLNFGFEDQAVNRIHRIGQTKKTSVVRFVAKKTIEEKIFSLQQQKRQLEGKKTAVSANESDEMKTQQILELFDLS